MHQQPKLNLEYCDIHYKHSRNVIDQNQESGTTDM